MICEGGVNVRLGPSSLELKELGRLYFARRRVNRSNKVMSSKILKYWKKLVSGLLSFHLFFSEKVQDGEYLELCN